jgi:hypothetical protein
MEDERKKREEGKQRKKQYTTSKPFSPNEILCSIDMENARNKRSGLKERQLNIYSGITSNERRGINKKIPVKNQRFPKRGGEKTQGFSQVNNRTNNLIGNQSIQGRGRSQFSSPVFFVGFFYNNPIFVNPQDTKMSSVC